MPAYWYGGHITTLYNLVYRMLRTLIITMAIIFVLGIYFAIAWVVSHVKDTELPGPEDKDDSNNV